MHGQMHAMAMRGLQQTNLEEVQKVRAEQHVILHDDGVTVLLIQKDFVQGPLVVLREPGMPRLQTHTHSAMLTRRLA